ncbi:MAG: hypothetical protein ACO3UZ_07035, partial [Burkholderiaceae bacterium]
MSVESPPAIRVAIDAMGGDHGLVVTIPAAVEFLERNPGASVLLVGQAPRIEAALGEQSTFPQLQ